MKTQIKFLIIFLFVSTVGLSQNCYKLIADMSGIDNAPYQTQLENAACELKNSFPEEFRNKFKVYDFGFYSMTEYMQGGFQAVWDKVVLNAASESEYYLVFGKQTDHSGVYTKFWVAINLPDRSNFSCLTPENRTNIYQGIEYSVSANYNGIPQDYANAEMAAMKRLQLIVDEVIHCCDPGNRTSCSFCIPSDNTIKDFLKSDDYTQLTIPTLKVSGFLSNLRKGELSQGSRSTNDYVTDLARLELSINNTPFDIEEKLESHFADLASEYNFTPKVFIVKNGNTCDNSQQNAINEINNNLPNLGVIVYLQDYENADTTDFVHIKLYGTFPNANIIGASAGEGESAIGGGAVNFEDLFTTVKQAEQKLIDSGHSSIADRIKILRGIYYGTTWSMDFGQEGSAWRNSGFNSYLYTPGSPPLDPRTILGDELFNKLKNSPEVKSGNKGVDFGHIMIGLESRLSYLSSERNFPLHEATGLEIVTWIGDLGGGAGMLAHQRCTDPNIRAKSKFTNENNFGGWLNIEGDIAAYLVAKDKNTVFSPPDVKLKDNEFIADALKDYLINDKGGDWTNRVSIFKKMIGGDVDDTKLTNYLANKIEDFAENYLIIRKTSNPSVNLHEASAHLKGAAKEVAEIFVNILNQPCSDRISVSGKDPNPTPKGKHYVKYGPSSETKKKFNDLLKDMEKWIKE
jgi:hypothetical protein